MNFLVKSTRTCCRRIKTVFVVSGSYDKDIFILLEPIHFRKNLVNRRTWRTVFTLSALSWKQTVYFVNENDTRLRLASFSEKLSDTLRSNSNKHFIKIRSSAVNKVAPRLTSNCSRQQSLASSRLAKEHYSFVELAALCTIDVWIFNHGNHIIDFIFDFIDSFNIIKPLIQLPGFFNLKFTSWW